MTRPVSVDLRRNEVDEHRALRLQLRQVLERNWSDQHLRDFADGNRAVTTRPLSILRDSMALDQMMLPARLGGLGVGCLEIAIAAEELGASMMPSTLLSATMSCYLLSQTRPEDVADVVSAVAERVSTVTVVWPGDRAAWCLPPDPFVDAADGSSRATVARVPHADSGDIVLIPARRGADGGFYITDIKQVAFSPVQSPDVLRPLHDVDVVRSDRFVSLGASSDRIFASMLALGSMILAAEMIGAARAAMFRTVDYCMTREQFGQPIATFQAVKHRIVDLLVEWETARALTYRAAESGGILADTHSVGQDFLGLAKMAKSAASDSLRTAAREAIQLHGGIGFAWENPSHFYLKKWASSSRLYGQPNALRRQLFDSAVEARVG